MKAKFKYPPINELVIGVYFDSDIVPLRAEHVGMFWSTVREKFPSISQHNPVIRPVAQILPFEFEDGFPMPRFWLESVDQATIIQIQKNAFLFNWRKRDSTYPHFDAVKAQFDTYFNLFSRFVKDEFRIDSLNIQVAELMYTNLIEKCDYWTGYEDTAAVIPLFRLPIPLGQEVSQVDFNQITSKRMAADLTLTTSIKTGLTATVPNTPVLVFELRAVGLLADQDKASADLWLGRAHDVIGDCFTKMTNPDIQERYWQLS